MSNRGGNKGLLIRLGVLVVLGIAGVIIALNVNSPLSISESEVRQMVRNHSLVGLPLKDAAKKLQHDAPATTDGSVVFDFDQVKGWKAGKLCLDVMNGKVTAASWLPADGVEDVRQDQGDGSDGGAAQGQGAPTGIRAKNQTPGGGGPR